MLDLIVLDSLGVERRLLSTHDFKLVYEGT